VWKEGDVNGMSVENLDKVEGMFSVVNSVYMWDTAGDDERKKDPSYSGPS